MTKEIVYRRYSDGVQKHLTVHLGRDPSKEEVADQKVITDIYDTGGGKIELLEATSDDSPISKFLEKRGVGVHHIAFLVDDLKLALSELSKSGVDLIDAAPRIGAEGMLIAFLHPKSTSGVLVELCQRP